jgi:hypothetical protein
MAPGNLSHASGSQLLAVGSLVARQRQHAVGMVLDSCRVCLFGRGVRRHGLGHLGRLRGHRGGLSGKRSPLTGAMATSGIVPELSARCMMCVFRNQR